MQRVRRQPASVLVAKLQIELFGEGYDAAVASENFHQLCTRIIVRRIEDELRGVLLQLLIEQVDRRCFEHIEERKTTRAQPLLVFATVEDRREARAERSHSFISQVRDCTDADNEKFPKAWREEVACDDVPVTTIQRPASLERNRQALLLLVGHVEHILLAVAAVTRVIARRRLQIGPALGADEREFAEAHALTRLRLSLGGFREAGLDV